MRKERKNINTLIITGFLSSVISILYFIFGEKLSHYLISLFFILIIITNLIILLWLAILDMIKNRGNE